MKRDLFADLRGNGKNLALKTVKNKIEQFIADGVYVDLDDFISDNADLDTFQNHTKLNNTLRKVWGYQITEEDYQEILEQLKQELSERKEIDMENVETVKANGKELTTYHGEEGTIVLDNSYNDKAMDKQLQELQDEHEQFQTGGKENIDAMMGYMQEEVKPEVEFESLEQAAFGNLSEEEQRNLQIARHFEAQKGEDTQVDVKNGLIMQDGNISTIEERDSEIGVYSAEVVNSSEQEENDEEKTKESGKVKTLQLFKQAGFSNALILAFLVGIVLGITFLGSYIKVILP